METLQIIIIDNESEILDLPEKILNSQSENRFVDRGHHSKPLPEINY